MFLEAFGYFGKLLEVFGGLCRCLDVFDVFGVFWRSWEVFGRFWRLLEVFSGVREFLEVVFFLKVFVSVCGRISFLRVLLHFKTRCCFKHLNKQETENRKAMQTSTNLQKHNME